MFLYYYLNIKHKLLYNGILQCKFKNLIFNNPISNASGVFCKERSDLLEMLHSFSGTFITKSCTFNPRPGNEKPSYWENDRVSINSMGLPNYGYIYYIDFIRQMNHEKLNKHCFSLLQILIMMKPKKF